MQNIKYSPTNEELVQKCLDGDPEAWNTLVDRYARLVRTVPKRFGLNSEDIADVTQDVFLSLAQNLHQLKDRESLAKWLLVTARNLSWRLSQRLSMEDVVPVADLTDAFSSTTGQSFTDIVPSVTELAELWYQRDILSYGLDKLRVRCRQLLYMLFLDPEQPGYVQICEHLQISIGSIGPMRKRCLQQLRMIIEDLDGVREYLS